MILYYNIYRAFVESWRTSTLLAHLWNQMALDALSMGESEFEVSILTFTIGGFKVEFFSFDAEITRAFVVAVANVMVVHTMRGFCGCFNARVVKGKESIWITMTVRDPQERMFGGK